MNKMYPVDTIQPPPVYQYLQTYLDPPVAAPVAAPVAGQKQESISEMIIVEKESDRYSTIKGIFAGVSIFTILEMIRNIYF